MSCSNSGVLRTSYNQLTGSQRTALLAEATAYRSGTVITNTRQFKSSTQYLAYIKARTIAQSTNGPGPVPSVIVTDLQETYRLTPPVSYPSTYNVLTSPSTTIINSSGQGTISGVYWKVCDVSSSLFAAMPRLNAVHQITSVSLSYYTGFSFGTSLSSDAQFSVERDTDPSDNTVIFFVAERKRVVPPQFGNTFALGSPPNPAVGGAPLTYPNASYTITDQNILQTMFGQGTDTIDKTRGFQFYWSSDSSNNLINNSQINEFIINYTYSICPDIPFSVPGVPTDVQIIDVGSGFVIVSWVVPSSDGGSPILYYIVTATPYAGLRIAGLSPRSLNPRVAGIVTAQGFSPLKVTGLTNNETYTFSVVAVSAGGRSQPSESSEPATPVDVPSPPLNVVAVAGNAQVTLSWDPPESGEPIIGYYVSGPGVLEDVSASPITITGLQNGTSYVFNVEAYNANGPSDPAPSNAVTPFTNPGPPSSLQAIPGDQQVRLQWIASSNTGGVDISGYIVTVDPPDVTVTPSPLLYVIVPGLTNGEPYYFSVFTQNVAGLLSTAATVGPIIPQAGDTAPDPPLDVTATVVGVEGQVEVSWTPPLSDGGSAIEYYSITSIPEDVTLDVSGDVTSITLVDLFANVEYFFVMTATNAIDTSVESDPSNTVFLGPPDAPTDVSGIAGDESVTVSWTAPVNNGGYEITSYTVEDIGAGVSQDVSGDVIETTIVGLTNGESYSFTVAATNFAGTSLPSDPVVLTPEAVTLTPPTNVTTYFDTVNFPGFLFVSWTAPTDTGGFTILRYRIDPFGDGPISTDTVYSTPYASPGTEYSVTVTALFVEGGESPASEPSAPPILFGQPTPPTNVDASAGTIPDVVVTWTAPVTNGGYNILYYMITIEPGTITRTSEGASTELLISDLIGGVTYTFTVIAVNGVLDSQPSEPFTYFYGTVPDPPTDVAGIAGNESVTVTWNPPINNGGYEITSYTVEDAAAGVSQDVSGDVTSTTITGLTNGESYSFTVTATNFAGTSDPSDPVVLTPQAATAPDPPTNVIGTAGSVSVVIDWSPPVNDGGYPITLYTVEDTGAGISRDVSGDITDILIVGLTNYQSYSFTVTATNDLGTSIPSDPPLVLMPSATGMSPTNLVAYFDSVYYPGEILLGWAAPPDTGGYDIVSYRTDCLNNDRSYFSPFSAVNISGLAVGIEYSFIVVAILTEGQSPPSDPSAPILFGPPSSPIDISASLVDVSSVLISWTPPTNGSGLPVDGGYPILSYSITVEPGLGSTTVGAESTEVTIPNAVEGIFYTITVVATNEIDDSQPSLPLSFSYGTVPNPPTDVSGIAGNESVTLSWTAPTNTGGYPITSYTVQDGVYGISQDVSGDITETTIVGLVNEQTYAFVVVATNFAGTSDPSEPIVLIPQSGPLPDPPTGVTASFDSVNSPGVLFINWTAPTDTGGLTIFRYRIDTIGFSFNSESTTFSTSFLTPGLEYSFTVTAVFNEGGESPPSDPSEYILFGPPRPPTGVEASAVASDMQVIWTVPVTDGGYPISSYTVTLEPGTITQTVDGVNTYAIISGCTFGVTYTITVVATNSFSSSDASEPISYLFVTRPNPPTSVFTELTGFRNVSISWTPPVFDGGSAIEKYRVVSIPGAVVEETIDAEPSILINFPSIPPNTYSFIIITITESGESLPSNPSNQIIV